MDDKIRSLIEQSIDCKRAIALDSRLIQQIGIAVHLINQAYLVGKKIVIFGNGGSAADAQHFAAELVSRFLKERPALFALALTTNTSILTAIANDYDYGKVFERQVEAVVAPGDVVIGISTSGNSSNVYRGLVTARDKGAATVGLLGGSGGTIASQCEITLLIPSSDTPRIQEAHIMIIHIICALLEDSLFGST